MKRNRQNDSPFRRSIGLSALMRLFMVIAAVLAIGAAFTTRNVAMGIAGLFLMVAALVLGWGQR
jgi:hypothetical protein